jgi:predicted dehydrogenase
MTIRRGALLGFGNVAERGHLPAWTQRKDVEIAAVLDLDGERRSLAARVLPDAHVYDEAAQLFRREELDFVDIATPPALHAPLIVQAARHGCHVLCEKPLATSAIDCNLVTRTVRDAGVTLFTVHNWKHSEPFRRVARIVREDGIGALKQIRFETVRNGQSVTVGEEWRTRAAIAGGGILVDHGWHNFYLLLALANEKPVRVRAMTERRRYSTADVEDTADCRIEFPSLTADLHLTWAGRERRTSWHLLGDRGSLLLEEERLEIQSGSRRESVELPESLSAGSHHPEWFAGVIDDFLAEVEGLTPRGANLSEAECCLSILNLAYQSAREGGEFVSYDSFARNN